ncbi:MAG: hypothetical protein K6L75_02410 [Cellvibrionaceae bacterium]
MENKLIKKTDKEIEVIRESILLRRLAKKFKSNNQKKLASIYDKAADDLLKSEINYKENFNCCFLDKPIKRG